MLAKMCCAGTQPSKISIAIPSELLADIPFEIPSKMILEIPPERRLEVMAVSYTHLTLPTSDLV